MCCIDRRWLGGAPRTPSGGWQQVAVQLHATLKFFLQAAAGGTMYFGMVQSKDARD